MRMETSFMGLIIKPGKKSKVKLPEGVKLSVNQATLGEDCIEGKCVVSATRIDVDGKSESAIVLARLQQGNIESHFLGGVMFTDETVVFEVTGPNAVHISGVTIEDPETESDDDDDAMGEESAAAATESHERKRPSDESDEKSEAAKRQKMKTGAEQASAKQAEVEAVAKAKAKQKAAAEAKKAQEAKRKAMEVAEQIAMKAKAAAKAKAADRPSFIASKKFTGAKAGYVFKRGPKGNGYYCDQPAHGRQQTPAQALAKLSPAAAKKQKTWTDMSGGLKYLEFKAGSGPKPRKGSNVKCKYVLRLGNVKGRVIDKSGPRGFEFKIGIGQVIKGWDIGVMAMPKGSKRALLVPPHLGYGKSGAPPDIPRNTTLYFEVELC